MLGITHGHAKVIELFFHQITRGALLDELGDALGGGVGAVCGAERVVDVNIGDACELFRKFRVVFFFLLVKPEVFKEQDVAVVHGGHGLGHGVSDAVVDE